MGVEQHADLTLLARVGERGTARTAALSGEGHDRAAPVATKKPHGRGSALKADGQDDRRSSSGFDDPPETRGTACGAGHGRKLTLTPQARKLRSSHPACGSPRLSVQTRRLTPRACSLPPPRRRSSACVSAVTP